jgi:hypothetical protein
MTNNNSSNDDKDFPIPKEIRDYYEYEFVWVINKKKRFVEIVRSHILFFKLSLAEFKEKVLRRILDEFNETRNLSKDEKKYLIEFKSKMEGF